MMAFYDWLPFSFVPNFLSSSVFLLMSSGLLVFGFFFLGIAYMRSISCIYSPGYAQCPTVCMEEIWEKREGGGASEERGSGCCPFSAASCIFPSLQLSALIIGSPSHLAHLGRSGYSLPHSRLL